MSDFANDYYKPHKLTEGELEEVAGGTGYWDSAKEQSYSSVHALQRAQGKTNLPFEQWLKKQLSTNYDAIKARDAWIAAQKPNNSGYFFDDGKTWTRDI